MDNCCCSKCFCTPCKCGIVPISKVRVPQALRGPQGPPGPPGPPAQACCPCTNLLVNPGFDLSPEGAPPAGWVAGQATVVGSPNSNSGRFVSSPQTPVIQAVNILGLNPNPPAGTVATPGFISQPVQVSAGCCYTLSFATDVRDGGVLVASVSFLDATPPQTCTPLITNTNGILTNPILTQNIPHIVVPGPQPQSGFQNYTLVVCTPPGATIACITFQNIGNPAPGGEAFVDNVVFENTGGPCTTCTQNF